MAPIASLAEYERAAADWVQACDANDGPALDRLNQHYRRTYSFDDLHAEIWRRVYAFRQRSRHVARNYLEPDEARILVAQDSGFESWDALIAAVATGQSPNPPFTIDSDENAIRPTRQLSDLEWDALLAVMKERRIATLASHGVMTDALLRRIVELEHVTTLDLGESRQLTDDGLRRLARMPQLEHLNLSQYPGGTLTDRGLEVLRDLPNLRTFEMTWQKGITDAGVSNLRFCDRLERVDLMGTATGDGAIAALQGKLQLRRFSTGRMVTDAGLRLLRNFPRLAHYENGAETQLLIDGPFTDTGLTLLKELDGVTDLDLFWHVRSVTASGFAHLAGLTNLQALGADGELSGDEALRHIAAIPRLRKLRIQESVATDAGFRMLSESQSLETLWGRVCPNFTSDGFLALSTMPSLRRLGIGCDKVSGAALSALPHFPALRELTPIGFTDDGFRHVGTCHQLQRLECMYCRGTGDAATEHVADLELTSYYAGLTQITDRSLEILGRMSSLERIELYECQQVTDAGIASLAALPQLREVNLEGMTRVSLRGTRGFPPRVRVKYHT